MPAFQTLRRFATRMASTRRAATAAALALAIAATTACGGDDKDDNGSTGPDGNGIAGTYALQTIEGEELPLSFEWQIELPDGEIADVLVTINSGSVKLNGDGTYASKLSVTFEWGEGEGEDEEINNTGRYTRNGNTLHVDPDDPELDSFEAQLSGNTITASQDPFETGEAWTLVFRK